jgi:hypothetical protein
MGYPYPLPKKFLCGFVRIPGVIPEASGGVQPPQTPPPVAAPLAIVSYYYAKTCLIILLYSPIIVAYIVHLMPKNPPNMKFLMSR